MSGADLYVFDAGNATWRWVGTCKVIAAGQGQPLPYVASTFSFPHADRPAGFNGEVGVRSYASFIHFVSL